MDRQSVLGMIVMCGICFGCGLLFCGIAQFAAAKPTPMGFWANGPEIKPEDISDIAAYNRENAILWKRYSIPYWLSGIAGIGLLWSDYFAYVCLFFLVLAGTVGLWWLISSYKKIWNRYKTA